MRFAVFVFLDPDGAQHLLRSDANVLQRRAGIGGNSDGGLQLFNGVIELLQPGITGGEVEVSRGIQRILLHNLVESLHRLVIFSEPLLV